MKQKMKIFNKANIYYYLFLLTYSQFRRLLTIKPNNMLIKQISPYISLRKTADQCLRNKNQYTSSVMGILIDVTAPLLRQRDKQYIVELKIIDQSVNQNNIYGVMIKYCSVFIFMQKETQLAFCNKIGQVVYLSQFIFSIWHGIKLETKFLSRTEKLCCYDIEGENIKCIGMMCSADSTEPKLHLLGQRIQQIRKWFASFFFKNFTPSIGISVMNNYTLMAQPFIMILKYAKQQVIIQNFQSKNEKSTNDAIKEFQDSNGNHFFLKRSMLKREFPESSYVYLRGVKCLGNFFQIIMTETGNILGLPDGFEENYENIMNYCAVSRFNQKFLLKNHKPCLLSRITYAALETTPIAKILKQVDQYSIKESTRQQAKIDDYYMIEGVAINFHGELHMFHTEYQVIIHSEFILSLSDDEKREMVEENKLSYLYEGHIGMIDRSSQRTGKLFYVHLFSNQARTQFYDPSLINELVKQVGSTECKKMQKAVKQKIESKLRNLIEKSTFQNPISMLLQPIKADSLIFRLTNTIFE